MTEKKNCAIQSPNLEMSNKKVSSKKTVFKPTVISKKISKNSPPDRLFCVSVPHFLLFILICHPLKCASVQTRFLSNFSSNSYEILTTAKTKQLPRRDETKFLKFYPCFEISVSNAIMLSIWRKSLGRYSSR